MEAFQWRNSSTTCTGADDDHLRQSSSADVHQLTVTSRDFLSRESNSLCQSISSVDDSASDSVAVVNLRRGTLFLIHPKEIYLPNEIVFINPDAFRRNETETESNNYIMNPLILTVKRFYLRQSLVREANVI